MMTASEAVTKTAPAEMSLAILARGSRSRVTRSTTTSRAVFINSANSTSIMAMARIRKSWSDTWR